MGFLGAIAVGVLRTAVQSIALQSRPSKRCSSRTEYSVFFFVNKSLRRCVRKDSSAAVRTKSLGDENPQTWPPCERGLV